MKKIIPIKTPGGAGGFANNRNWKGKGGFASLLSKEMNRDSRQLRRYTVGYVCTKTSRHELVLVSAVDSMEAAGKVIKECDLLESVKEV